MAQSAQRDAARFANKKARQRRAANSITLHRSAAAKLPQTFDRPELSDSAREFGLSLGHVQRVLAVAQCFFGPLLRLQRSRLIQILGA